MNNILIFGFEFINQLIISFTLHLSVYDIFIYKEPNISPNQMKK